MKIPTRFICAGMPNRTQNDLIGRLCIACGYSRESPASYCL